MQIFRSPAVQTEDDHLLKTAIELYQRDREKIENRRTAEQVLAELDIPLEYLEKAKLQIGTKSQPQRSFNPQRAFLALVIVTTLFVLVGFTIEMLLTRSDEAHTSQSGWGYTTNPAPRVLTPTVPATSTSR